MGDGERPSGQPGWGAPPSSSGAGSPGGSGHSGHLPLRPPIGAKNPLTGQPLSYSRPRSKSRPGGRNSSAPESEPEEADEAVAEEPTDAAADAPTDAAQDGPVEPAEEVAEETADEAAEQTDEQAAEEAVEEAEQAVLADLAKLAAERDDYLDQLRRTKADFENYRKRILRQQTEQLERAAEGLAEKLLPVLDTFDAALAHGQGYEQVHASLMSTLEKEGLERIDPAGKPFDPAESDAVAHEEGEGGPVVAEVLRAGYRWKGRVIRPAMVRVRG